MGQALVLAGKLLTPIVLNRIYGQADTTSHIVTQISFSNLSTSYSIPANDAQPGTAYRITTWGNGTWGSTAQAFTVACALAGTDIGTTPVIASGAFSVSAAFDFEIQAKVVCVSNGSVATWIASVKGNLSETANPLLPGTVADNSVGFSGCTHTAVTQDSTISNSFAIQAKWASATGAPSITALATIFEKVN